MRTSRRRAAIQAAALLLLALATLACAQTGGAPPPAPALSVEQGWTWAGPKGRYESPVFLVLENRGAADQLVGASSAAARRVELRAAIPTDSGTKMREVGAIPVPAQQRLSLTAETYYLVLIAIDHDLAPGDSVAATLRFASGARIDTVLQVLPAGQHAAGAAD